MADVLDTAVDNAIGRLFQGSDQSFQSAVRSALDDNIYDQFLYRLLFSSNSIPLQAQWILLIEQFPEGIPDTLNTFSPQEWEIGESHEFSKKEEFHTKENGCIFAQSINMPGDGIDITRQGVDNSGFIKGIISSGRREFEHLKVSFLETNTSFTDYVLRPWTAAVGYRSLKDQNLKTNITVFNFKKVGSGSPLRPRKITTFHNVVPISIDTEEYNYSGDKVIQRAVSWAYEYYTMSEESTNYIKDTIFDFLGNATGIRGLENLGNAATRVLKGDLTQVVNTTAGFIDDVVSGVATNIRGDLLGGQGPGEVNVNTFDTAANTTISTATGSSNDTPHYDTIANGVAETSLAFGNKLANLNKIVSIPTDDTPSSAFPLETNNITTPVNDSVSSVNILPAAEGSPKTLNQVVDDVISDLKIADDPRANDTVDNITQETVESLKSSISNKEIDTNDTVDALRLDSQNKIPNRSDVITGTDFNTSRVTPNVDDTVGRITVTKTVSPKSDTVGNISVSSLIPPKEDVVKENRLAPRIVTPDRNDHIRD